MTYICPKCGVSLTDHEYLDIPCRHENNKKEDVWGTCPACGQESHHITDWERKEGDFEAATFDPQTATQCENLCCVYCVQWGANDDSTHGNCDQQNRLNGCSHQANLFNF